MLINCYYYAPHNHTMLSNHIEYDLEKMIEIGTDIVSICVSESQLKNWHWKRIENFIRTAHGFGLKVHAVPNRWAGIFAGWLDGFSDFSMKNIDQLVEDKNGKPVINDEMVCCFNKPAVRNHIKNYIKLLLDIFPFDGIVWDEPHTVKCHCSYCLDAKINSYTKTCEAFSNFIDEMSSRAKQCNSNITISLFVQPQCEELLEALLSTKNIDYLGSDGHLRSDSHRMHVMKKTIFEAHDKYYDKLKAAGHPPFFLIEGQRHRDEDLQDYLVNLEKAFSLPMEQLMYYYSAHEMSQNSEKTFNEATWQAVKQAKEVG